MDPTLADGERVPRQPGPLARVPADLWWVLLPAIPVLLLALHLGGFVGRVPDRWSGRVAKVLDGDTLVVWQGAFSRTIRLADVDCPERLQPHGDDATAFVRERVRDADVEVRNLGLDKYGRVLGEVRLPDGETLAGALLDSGNAWFNHRYSSREDYRQRAARARAARLGLWADERPVAPWEFRRANR